MKLIYGIIFVIDVLYVSKFLNFLYKTTLKQPILISSDYEYKRCVSAFGVNLVPASDILPILEDLTHTHTQQELAHWALSRECLKDHYVRFYFPSNPISPKFLIFQICDENENCFNTIPNRKINLSNDVAILIDRNEFQQSCEHSKNGMIILNVY